jgi:NADPH-dependent 2,4-dienoyl-CoA reductase/sulfur reductase-like enzyme
VIAEARYDVVVIGAGPAGLAAAVRLRELGVERVLVVDREEEPGGILQQCVHTGFGLHLLKEDLTGPEYAERWIDRSRERGVEMMLSSAAVDIVDRGDEKEVFVLSGPGGLARLAARAVILGMGCRERNRGNINIPGSRPAGVMTAGFAQKLVNIAGFLPGREVVILGSGDIGLIMARRLSLEGVLVRGVVELQPFPGGLNRNIVQCLHDFSIPLYLSHTITDIRGHKRVEAVEVSEVGKHFEPKRRGRFTLRCDTLLLSVGLVPENELSRRAGVAIDPVTGGPVVDAGLMTTVRGLFACGNVLHVHDLVDYVSEEGSRAADSAARYLAGELDRAGQIPVRTGNMVRYVVPPAVEPGRASLLSLRPLHPAEDATLVVRGRENVYHRERHRKVFPSSMLRFELPPVPPGEKSLEVLFEQREAGRSVSKV